MSIRISMPKIDFDQVNENAEITLDKKPGVQEGSDEALDDDNEPWAPEPTTSTADEYHQIFPLPEPLSTVTPDAAVPRRDTKPE
jgi:hypothetical protein